jgi:hypothetical protein
MGVSTERTVSAQLAMAFPVAKPRAKPRAISRLNAANAPSAVQLRSDITGRLRRYAVCSLAKMLHDIKKANSVGYPYYLKELFSLFNAYEENGKVRMDKLPTPEQAGKANSLLVWLGNSNRHSRNRDDFRWRVVTPEQQHAASAKEHLSNIFTIAGLNSLLKSGEHDDFLLVFDSIERDIMEKARKPARYGGPRVSGHEVRMFIGLRSAGIPEKVEQLSHLEKVQ